MISLINISKSYDKTPILNKLNLSFKKGEFITLLGASGCGKSTLLNILSGFESFEGEIRLENQAYKNILPISSKRIKIFQNYALLEYKSVLQNVLFALKCQNVPKNEALQRAEFYLELVGLSDRKNHFINELSGGQQQRVALARALSIQPEMLLLDEPFSALDSFTRKRLQDELLHLANKLKMSVVFVTHDIEEAIYLGSSIVLLKDGKILANLKSLSDKSSRQSLEFNALKDKIENLLKGNFYEDYAI